MVNREPEPGAGFDHWRSMAADTKNHFWFTNRESAMLLAEVDRLRGRVNELLDAHREQAHRIEFLSKLEKDNLARAEAAEEDRDFWDRKAGEEHVRADGYRKVMLEIADCIDAAPLPDNREPENIFERAKRLAHEYRELRARMEGLEK